MSTQTDYSSALEAQRAVWLREVPELERLFDAMPQQSGKLDVHYKWMANGILLLGTLAGSAAEELWHNSLFIPTRYPGKVTARLIIAQEQIERMGLDAGSEPPAQRHHIDLADWEPPQSALPV